MSIFSISASSSSSLLPNVSFFSSNCCYSFLTPPTHNNNPFLPIVKSTKKKPIEVTISMEAGIGVMATKLGMMSFFQPNDKVVPVTDGYEAVQVGYRRVKDRKQKWVISREGQKSCLGRKQERERRGDAEGNEREGGVWTRLFYIEWVLFCEPLFSLTILEQRVRCFFYCCSIQSHLT